MKEKILELLKGLKPDVDFEHNDHLIEDGALASLDIIQIIGALDDEFGVSVPAMEIRPANFNSVDGIVAMVTRLQEE